MNLPRCDQRGFYRKANVVRDAVLYDLYLYTHPRCECCGRRFGLSRHHIIGGAGRSDEVCNLICLCLWRCHPLAEGERIVDGGVVYEPLSLGQVLTLKSMTAPDDFDPWRLAELYGQALPDFQALPGWVK